MIASANLESQMGEPPIAQLLLIFGIYGGLGLVTLHLLTWLYSGMAFLGLVAVTFVAPFLGFWVSYSLRQLRRKSRWHNTLFVLGLLYLPAVITLLVAMFLVANRLEGGV